MHCNFVESKLIGHKNYGLHKWSLFSKLVTFSNEIKFIIHVIVFYYVNISEYSTSGYTYRHYSICTTSYILYKLLVWERGEILHIMKQNQLVLWQCSTILVSVQYMYMYILHYNTLYTTSYILYKQTEHSFSHSWSHTCTPVDYISRELF